MRWLFVWLTTARGPKKQQTKVAETQNAVEGCAPQEGKRQAGANETWNCSEGETGETGESTQGHQAQRGRV
ncbi:MAG TPA: hypothetical protein PLF40_06805 [Kofleriaceae bacterium]|nr:hypothetical protein [Kofleriaceae bacterium]